MASVAIVFHSGSGQADHGGEWPAIDERDAHTAAPLGARVAAVAAKLTS